MSFVNRLMSLLPARRGPSELTPKQARLHRSTLGVEAMEDRTVPSTVAYGDINHDGLVDMATITNPTTVTISLANTGGGYTVSAVLTVPSNRPMHGISVVDNNGDGNLDIVATSQVNNNLYYHTWLGDGDGTFGNRHTQQWKPPRWFV